MEDNETTPKEERQIIRFMVDDIGTTKFDLIPGKEVLMRFAEKDYDSSQ